MKIKNSFVTHNSNGEQIMVDISGEFSGLVKSNQTAAFITDLLKKERTQEEIIDALYEKYDAPRDVLEKDLLAVLDKLREAGALSE